MQSAAIKILAQGVDGRDTDGVSVEEVGNGEGASHGFKHRGLDCCERDCAVF